MAVRQQVRAVIDQVNSSAGAAVSVQQSMLTSLVASGQAAAQHACPAAESTVAFLPVYARLAPAPGWRPAIGTLTGDVYALPTLIRIYTGDRITGTDLTDLHLVVQGGAVRLPALCLN